MVNDLAVNNPPSETDTASTPISQPKVEEQPSAPVQAPPILPPHPHHMLPNLPLRIPFPPPPVNVVCNFIFVLFLVKKFCEDISISKKFQYHLEILIISG